MAVMLMNVKNNAIDNEALYKNVSKMLRVSTQ